MSDIKSEKAIVAAERKVYRETARKYKKIQAQRQRDCYWTWPWGHMYETRGPYTKVCMVCNKEIYW